MAVQLWAALAGLAVMPPAVTVGVLAVQLALAGLGVTVIAAVIVTASRAHVEVAGFGVRVTAPVLVLSGRKGNSRPAISPALLARAHDAQEVAGGSIRLERDGLCKDDV